MDPAWIGLAGGVIGTVASAVVAVRQARDSERLARLNGELQGELARLEGRLQADLARLTSDLEAERHERVALLDRDLRAEDVLARYREPLAAGAFDLQSRCYNILRLNFFGKFGTGQERFPEAQMTTLFRFAQYFGWTEILRRDIQFLSFPEADDTRRVAQLQSSIARRLASSEDDAPLMIWADEQRAIGERMIVQEHDTVLCMGYARFCDEYDARFGSLCRRLLADLLDPSSARRLRGVQHLLCELIEMLDARRVRYTEDLERA
jgi:hypothetical protein